MRFMRSCRTGKDGTSRRPSRTCTGRWGNQPEPQARQLQLALELFVTGSLDLFNGQTHIQRQKKKDRLTVYGIAGLGQEQAAIGMLIMLEGIRARIASNARKGKATWLYIDEFHNLASQEFLPGILRKSGRRSAS